MPRGKSGIMEKFKEYYEEMGANFKKHELLKYPLIFVTIYGNYMFDRNELAALKNVNLL